MPYCHHQTARNERGEQRCLSWRDPRNFEAKGLAGVEEGSLDSQTASEEAAPRKARLRRARLQISGGVRLDNDAPMRFSPLWNFNFEREGQLCQITVCRGGDGGGLPVSYSGGVKAENGRVRR
ncbi:hypothetical protein HAX54_051047 [Datura stramonium]|uniref:Uncharacterized protein n=1 Tax=Datura stramonium TaxID=4076 RepID=A0ABS8RR67_DATST|nr:hypothetical protein [Datura stramonium]